MMLASLFGGLIGILFMLVFLAIGIAVLVFWIMMLVDCIKNPNLSSNERIVWVLVIVFASWLGALIYMLAGRKK
jgi:hypothetical protein